MIYLASPYTHPDPVVREARFRAVCRQTAAMLRSGIQVFSPIAYTHALVEHGLPVEWAFWEEFDRAFLKRSWEVWVLKLDGWQESVGVQAEIRLARKLGKPVVFVEVGERTPDTSEKGV